MGLLFVFGLLDFGEVQFLLSHAGLVRLEVTMEIYQILVLDDQKVCTHRREVAVVGHQNESRRVREVLKGLEISLQPDYAEQVQEIGRLVEDQDIRVLQ